MNVALTLLLYYNARCLEDLFAIEEVTMFDGDKERVLI